MWLQESRLLIPPIRCFSRFFLLKSLCCKHQPAQWSGSKPGLVIIYTDFQVEPWTHLLTIPKFTSPILTLCPKFPIQKSNCLLTTSTWTSLKSFLNFACLNPDICSQLPSSHKLPNSVSDNSLCPVAQAKITGMIFDSCQVYFQHMSGIWPLSTPSTKTTLIHPTIILCLHNL